MPQNKKFLCVVLGDGLPGSAHQQGRLPPRLASPAERDHQTDQTRNQFPVVLLRFDAGEEGAHLCGHGVQSKHLGPASSQAPLLNFVFSL